MVGLSTALRLAAATLLALAFVGAPSSSQAASGSVRIEIVKAGFIVGVSGGSGSLSFKDRHYRLAIGGVSLGATIGASKAVMVGRVSNIHRASDVAGTYGAAGAGGAVIRGRRVVRLRNEKGAILELHGRQVGLEFSVDLAGMVIGLK